MTIVRFDGFVLHKRFLPPEEQSALVDDVRAIAKAAPFARPVTPGGKKMSVSMTSAGAVGWTTDRTGYRYEEAQPDGAPWPPIPDRLLSLWNVISGADRPPDTCLCNFYDASARMGLHQDKDEDDFDQPVVSVSLGDAALYRYGGLKRSDPTRSVLLESGDVLVMGGAARLKYHGIDRIRAGTSTLLSKGGRLNLTLRVTRV